jgi:hypothetical protein
VLETPMRDLPSAGLLIHARRVILTHLGREMLAHRHEAAAECADDGLTDELPRPSRPRRAGV